LRKEKGLCFWCGVSGYLVEGYLYYLVVNPSKPTGVRFNIVSFPPILEDSELDLEDPGVNKAGKV
jgi:hypothetical protein